MKNKKVITGECQKFKHHMITLTYVNDTLIQATCDYNKGIKPDYSISDFINNNHFTDKCEYEKECLLLKKAKQK